MGPGVHMCSCDAGYTGSGRSCQGKIIYSIQKPKLDFVVVTTVREAIVSEIKFSWQLFKTTCIMCYEYVNMSMSV